MLGELGAPAVVDDLGGLGVVLGPPGCAGGLACGAGVVDPPGVALRPNLCGALGEPIPQRLVVPALKLQLLVVSNLNGNCSGVGAGVSQLRPSADTRLGSAE